MTASRILSQQGNVIAADFKPRPREPLTAHLSFKTDVLYRDDQIMVLRTTTLLAGQPFLVTHFMGDLASGRIATLQQLGN